VKSDIIQPMGIHQGAVHHLLSDNTTNFLDIVGKVTPPKGVAEFNTQAGGGDAIGLLIFVSNMIKLVTIVAGVIVLFNFISAGFEYVTSAGDASAANKVRDKITMSIIGLIIIVGSYTVIALLSVVFFGDPGYILNPKISGPSAPPVPGVPVP